MNLFSNLELKVGPKESKMSIRSHKEEQGLTKSPSDLEDNSIEGVKNIRTKRLFIFTRDTDQNEWVINTQGRRIPYDTKIFDDPDVYSLSDFTEEQLKTYNLLEVKDIEELEIEKNINTGMSKLLKGPYIEDTIWSVAKWAKRENKLTGSDRFFLGSIARKLSSREELIANERYRLLDVLLNASELGYGEEKK